MLTTIYYNILYYAHNAGKLNPMYVAGWPILPNLENEVGLETEVECKKAECKKKKQNLMKRCRS